MSYNIRFDNPLDGERAWCHRRDDVAAIIEERYRPDVLGMQEALRGQIDDLEERLPHYSWIGAARDDGKNKGEFSPIFFRKERFTPMDHGTFWLSETPDVPGSKSWDAYVTRVVSWIRLRDKQSQAEYLTFNTHFDHKGEVARFESAGLLLDKVRKMAGNLPVFITGDFNIREDSPVYTRLTKNSGFHDARYQSLTPHEGPTASTNDWSSPKLPEGRRIDYVFVNDAFLVLSHQILDDKVNGYYPSDHMPLLARLECKADV